MPSNKEKELWTLSKGGLLRKWEIKEQQPQAQPANTGGFGGQPNGFWPIKIIKAFQLLKNLLFLK